MCQPESAVNLKELISSDMKTQPLVEVSFDILEWLESECLEHQKRMQGLRCGSEQREMSLGLVMNAI